MKSHLKLITLVLGYLLANTTITPAANNSEEWRLRVNQIAADNTLSDSVKVIRISDLSYHYFYYYRTIDATYTEEYLRLVEPFIQQADSHDLLSYIYSTLLVALPSATAQDIEEKCIHHTGKCRNPIISAQSWERLGRKNILDASGLHYFSNALDAIKGLEQYAFESRLYGLIAIYYSLQEDRQNQLNYAQRSMELAIRSNDSRQLFSAWEHIAESHLSRNDYPAAIEAYNKAMDIYREKIQPAGEEDPDIRYRDDVHYMVLTVNLGSMYYYNGDLHQAVSLLGEALKTANHYNIVETQAYCHKEFGRICLETEDYKEAEKHLLRTEQLLAGDYVRTGESDHLNYEIKLALAQLYQHTGQYKKSAAYYQAGIEIYRALFDEELLAQNQQWAASYETRKQEEQIRQMQTVVAYHGRQKMLYIAILVTILLLLFFVTKLYRTRIRLVKQKEQTIQDKTKMLAFEKKKAELDKILKQNEANSLKQMQASGNELAERHNRALEEITALFNREPVLKQHQTEIKNIILQQNHINKNIDEFKEGVNNVPLDFYVRLQQIAVQKLTPLDLKYCRLIYLNTPSKEMAELLSVEHKTIRMNKYRLKQKLNLSKEDDLNEFIKNIPQY